MRAPYRPTAYRFRTPIEGCPPNSFRRLETSYEKLTSEKLAKAKVPHIPGRVPFGVEVKLAVGIKHSFPDTMFLRPDERQHAAYTEQGLRYPKLECHHKEFNHLLYH